MPDRREFLLGAAGVWSLARQPASLVSWLSNSPGKLGPIGIQLYTVRRELLKDPIGTLTRLAEIGFREVEFAGYPAGTPESLRQLLGGLHLNAISSHVSLQALRTDWERTVAQAAVLGQQYIVVAFVGVNERKTVEDWKRLAGEFNRAGAIARKHGLQFCYHNHDVEFPLLDGIVPYDLLLKETDPKLVAYEMDLYWITKAGRDPLEYFAQWPRRFPLVHVKDMDTTPQRSFADVGTGSIDFRRIFSKAQLAGIRHYFYEQDETPGDVFASAAASYRYLRALTF